MTLYTSAQNYALYLPLLNLGFSSSLECLVVRATSGHPNKVLQQLPALPRNLRTLILDQCKALTSLPESLGHCTQLERLVVRQAKTLTALPASIGKCAALRELNLLKCIALPELPVGVRYLPVLEDLILTKCKSLVQLWPAEGPFCNNHRAATQPMKSTPILPRLATLDVQQCKALYCLGMTSLPKTLRVLRCSQCPLLTSIPAYHNHLLLWDIRECPAAAAHSYPVLLQDKPVVGQERTPFGGDNMDNLNKKASTQEEEAFKSIQTETLI